MTSPIDNRALNRLELLAPQQDPTEPWWEWDDDYLAACDPTTVAALIRAVRAAVEEAEDAERTVRDGTMLSSFFEAIAPFRDQLHLQEEVRHT